jgi:thiol-disulfide isomerase/thioredoxin
MRVLVFAASLLFLTGCSGSSSSSSKASEAGGNAPQLARGPWHGALTVAGNQRLPFELTVLPDSAGQPRALLHNGGETFRLTEFDHASGDSLRIRLHVFDAVLVGRVERKRFTGYWQKLDAKTPFRVPFQLVPGRAAKLPARPALNFSGTWAVTFRDTADATSAYPAVGVFEQKGNVVNGTFLTETGDYRFLRGYAHKDSLRLFTFDGAHGYVFSAQRQPDGTLRGNFWSGLKGYEAWTARLDPKARLADAESLTGMKPGQDTLAFTFPDLHGRPVSLSDARFRGKVVIVQLLGTWCPNCMDESAYLAPFYRAHRAEGLELVGLAYERTRDTATVHPRLRRLAKRFGMEYPILLAGIASSDSAAASLPQLRDVKAFPTTIFIGRDGRVRRVHTGFSGPGTGKYYEEWKTEFNALVKELLAK